MHLVQLRPRGVCHFTEDQGANWVYLRLEHFAFELVVGLVTHSGATVAKLPLDRLQLFAASVVFPAFAATVAVEVFVASLAFVAVTADAVCLQFLASALVVAVDVVP